MRIEENVLFQIRYKVRCHFEAHKRYGKMTLETEMRFNDILSDIAEIEKKISSENLNKQDVLYTKGDENS